MTDSTKAAHAMLTRLTRAEADAIEPPAPQQIEHAIDEGVRAARDYEHNACRQARIESGLRFTR